jgi:hypothetical protein
VNTPGTFVGRPAVTPAKSAVPRLSAAFVPRARLISVLDAAVPVLRPGGRGQPIQNTSVRRHRATGQHGGPEASIASSRVLRM